MKSHYRRWSLAGAALFAATFLSLVSRGWSDSPRERVFHLPQTPYHYLPADLPAHFKTPAAQRLDNTPTNNQITDAGAALGRVLFYDTRLSENGSLACASCHQQNHAFADVNRFSKGHAEKKTDRHASSLVDLRFYARGRFFWDERSKSLEDQVLKPVQSKVEMGQDLAVLTDVLLKDERYQPLFREAFGDPTITASRVARALSQFVRSIVSYQSKYDVGLAQADSVQDNFVNFTAQENRGKTLFLNRCATCHLTNGQSAHFFMNSPMNNGLDADVKRTDGGVGDITLNPAQLGLFKSPSLRNVEFTGPYMHDGRFASLELVVDHYSRGIKQHPNLDPRLRSPMNFDTAQSASLVAFMKTLTDRHLLTDAKYSDPFQ